MSWADSVTSLVEWEMEHLRMEEKRKSILDEICEEAEEKYKMEEKRKSILDGSIPDGCIQWEASNLVSKEVYEAAQDQGAKAFEELKRNMEKLNLAQDAAEEARKKFVAHEIEQFKDQLAKIVPNTPLLEIVGHCPSCGFPIYGKKTWPQDAPLFARGTCNCQDVKPGIFDETIRQK